MPSPVALRGGLLLALCILTCVLVHPGTHTARAQTTNCEPNCTLGGNVADPLDCRRFYVCSGEDALGPLDCDEGEIFNVTESKCVPGDDCDPTCSGNEASCTYTCSDDPTPPVYIADRYDCSSYYQCDNGGLLTCQGDAPFFNGNKCQADESKCCSCKPYCEAEDAGTMIIDPIDCTKYYLCTEEELYSGHCSEGNFDPFLGECSPTVPCIKLCTNVVNRKGCIDMFTCEETGYFPACPKRCSSNYYHCKAEDVESTVTPLACINDNVYNPDNSQCVQLTDCPYPKPDP